jgi:hypothetical protein
MINGLLITDFKVVNMGDVILYVFERKNNILLKKSFKMLK